MRLDSKEARDYYINESRSQNWSVRVLERNIRSGYFERLLSSQMPIKPALTVKKQKREIVVGFGR
jgi:predicted nuclease of restriction endonuclease-like (RecB) superfamily